MTRIGAGLVVGLAVAGAATNNGGGEGTMARRDTTEVRVVKAERLPVLDGRQLHATLVEVRYGPGGSSRPHSHPCPVVGYVVDGALRTRVEGEVEAVYRKGQTFYEAPNGVHVVSANASRTEPVTFLAWFICDHDTPLAVPAAEGR